MKKRLKFIQVNINKGCYLDLLVEFLRSENPDIVSMQEVTSNEANLCENKSISLFEDIKQTLGMDGVYAPDLHIKEFPKAFYGNAIVSRFKIVGSKTISLKESHPLTKEEFSTSDNTIWPYVSRNLLDAVINVDGTRIHALSWHGAWIAPPQDTEETKRQAKIAVEYLKTLEDPFILGGDLNAIPSSKTVQMVSEVATNLMDRSGVVQTTHPTLHRISPRGFLVDYIFLSKHFRPISLSAPLVNVSDHLPVVGELEIVN